MSPALRNILVPVIVLLPVGVLLYAGSLRVPFILDDYNSIVYNTKMESWRGAFSAPAQSTVSGRPIVCFSLAINYAIGERAVGGYHVFNVSVHVLCALLLCGILRRTLEIARDQHQLVSEAEILAQLAEAYLGGGEQERALETSNHALNSARAHGAKLFECDARLAQARILIRSQGAAAADAIRAALQQVDELVEETGTRVHEPFERL